MSSQPFGRGFHRRVPQDRLQLGSSSLASALIEFCYPNSSTPKWCFKEEELEFSPQFVRIGNKILIFGRGKIEGEIYTFLLDAQTGKHDSMTGMHKIGNAPIAILNPENTKLIQKNGQIYLTSLLGVVRLDHEGRFMEQKSLDFQELSKWGFTDRQILNSLPIARAKKSFQLETHRGIINSAITYLTKKLSNEDTSVRLSAVYILGNYNNLPPETITALSQKLSDEDKNVRRAAVLALGKEKNLPPETITALSQKLPDEDENVSWEVVLALRNQTELPPEVFTLLYQRISDKSAAMLELVFGQQENVPRDQIIALSQINFDKDKNVRLAALDSLRLGRFIYIPLDVLNILSQQLSDEDKNVRRLTSSILKNRYKLPRDALIALSQSLSDEDEYVRDNAVNALVRNQKYLPAAIQKKLDDYRRY